MSAGGDCAPCEGADFARQVFVGDGAQVGFVTCVDFPRQIRRPSEHTADDPRDGNQQDGDQDQERHESAQCALYRGGVPKLRVLGNGDARTRWYRSDQDPVGQVLGALRVQRVQAVGQGQRDGNGAAC